MRPGAARAGVKVTCGGGKVYLVGAGPGDPGLITLRGIECLRRADLVVYDALVNPRILEHAPPSATLVCLGRRGGGRHVPQEEINARMLREARQGRIVVRLKNGDPAIFARGAEEADQVAGAGVYLEIVPGITAAVAAGSCAGFPLTASDLASAVAFVSGHEWHGGRHAHLDASALARFPGTLVFYMGETTTPEWAGALIAAGKPHDTPAAVVCRCSWPDQRVIHCQLAEIESVLKSQPVRPPAIVIIGPAADRQRTLGWFADRPLFGHTVLVTRPRAQAPSMGRRLAELGAQVLVQPAIEILRPPDWQPVDRAIAHLEQYRWVVFSSANGVRFFLDRIVQSGHDLRVFGGARLAAIGPGTAGLLREARLRADVQPEQFRAEALADALEGDVRGERLLLVRADRGRDVLPRRLAAAGATVEQVVAYSSRDVTSADTAVATAVQHGNIGWTTVTSSAIARSLANLFGRDLMQTKLVSISPVTSAVLRDLGYPPAAEATHYTIDGVIDAILGRVTSGESLGGRPR